jgi:hypothetical protein
MLNVAAQGKESMQPEAEEVRSLPGEELGIAPADARHWVRVYQELIEFCELLMTRPELSLEQRHIQRRLTHYRLRLGHWQEVLDLAG